MFPGTEQLPAQTVQNLQPEAATLLFSPPLGCPGTLLMSMIMHLEDGSPETTVQGVLVCIVHPTSLGF